MALPQRQIRSSAEGREQINKKNKRGFTPRKLSKLIIFSILVFMLFSFSSSFYQGYQLKEEIKGLEAQLAKVQQENMKLQEELKYNYTPEAIEKIAREKLGLIKPGEIVIMRAKEVQR